MDPSMRARAAAANLGDAKTVAAEGHRRVAGGRLPSVSVGTTTALRAFQGVPSVFWLALTSPAEQDSASAGTR
jgi:hypothetical protein